MSLTLTDLDNKIKSSLLSKDGRTSLLRFVKSEFESAVSKNSKTTLEQVIRKIISNNNICLESRWDEKIQEENEYLKTFLPSYLSVEELKTKLSGQGFTSSGSDVGKAIKFLRTNGLQFLPEDVKKALD